MKKRLLSMLMAVLMIASLVPATALAANATLDPVINIEADAAAKQPGITVTEVKNGDIVTGYNVEIKAFAKLADICDADKHVPVTKELIVADCGKAGLTVTYCSVCGTNLNKNVVTEPLHHDCEFTVVAAPVCAKADGWGYAVCKKCGNPIAVDKNSNFEALIEKGATESKDAYAKRVADVKALFEKSDAHNYQTVTADIKHVDKTTQKEVIDAYAGVEATHIAMLVEQGNFVNLDWQWKDGGYISSASAANFDELKAEGKVVEVNGDKVVAGVACTKCGDVKPNNAGGVVAGTDLNAAHAQYITVTDPGKRPVYFDPNVKQADGNYGDGSYKDGKAATYFCSKCGKTFGGEVLSAVKWFNITETAMPKIGDVKVYEDETVYQLVGKNVVEIPATQLHKAVAATCQKDGNTGDVIVYTASGAADEDGNIPAVWMLKEVGKKIDKIDHHFIAKPDKLATCKDDGVHYVGMYVCDNVVGKDDNGKDIKCNAAKNDVIHYETPITKAHTPTVVVLVEATCQHDGLSVLQCSVCKEYLNVRATNDGGYEYNETAATAGIAPAYVVKQVKHVAAAELKDAKEATCTEVGYTGDKVCKWCGIMLEKGKEIPMKEHTVVDVAAVEATCTEAGATAGTKCSVCGTVLSGCEKIDALGHKYENGVCTVCGEKDPNYVEPVAPEFKDADSIKDYAKDAVAWAAKEGVVKGDDQGNFNPTANITRQDFVTMLWRLKGETASEKELTFGDKADIKDYAQVAVAWAVENGYITGRDNGNFDPAAKITRAEIVAILNRVADNAKAEKAASFTDIGSHWAKDAIAWAAEAGIVNGVGNDLFAPNDNATRQDTVVMLYKFVNLK